MASIEELANDPYFQLLSQIPEGKVGEVIVPKKEFPEFKDRLTEVGVQLGRSLRIEYRRGRAWIGWKEDEDDDKETRTPDIAQKETKKDELRRHGLTGIIDQDGLLTPEQQELLDRMQSEAADEVMHYLDHKEPGDPNPAVVMATGIGKGNIIRLVIEKQKAMKPNSKILLIVGTKTFLIQQTERALARHRRNDESEDEQNLEMEDNSQVQAEADEASIEEGELKGFTVGKLGENKDVQVTIFQGLQAAVRRGTFTPEEADLVIVDELHNIGTK